MREPLGSQERPAGPGAARPLMLAASLAATVASSEVADALGVPGTVTDI